MKKFTKLLGIVLIMALVMSMGITAFADHTITVNQNATADQGTAGAETYVAYKIFDVTKTDAQANWETNDSDLGPGTAEGFAYTIDANSAWVSVVRASGFFDLVLSAEGDLYTVTLKDPDASTPANENNTAAKAKEIAEYFKTNAPEGIVECNPSAEGYNAEAAAAAVDKKYTFKSNGTTATVTVDDGYYMITSTLGTNLIAATSDIEITTKNEYVVDQKVVEKASVTVGENATYYIEVYLPATIDTTLPVVVHDILDEHLKFNNDVQFVVSATDPGSTAAEYKALTYAALTDAYTVKTGTDVSEAADAAEVCTFEININTSGLAGKYIVFKYSAELLSTAVNDTGYVNKEFSTYSEYTTKPSNPEVKTYDFNFTKVDGDNAKLDGAKFELYAAWDSTKNEASGDPIAFLKPTDTAKTTYKKADTDDTTGTVTEIVVNSKTDNAATVISGLGGADNTTGTNYYLLETEAPSGFNKLTAPIIVNVKDDGTITVSLNGETLASANDAFNVVNQSGTVLPSTGGIGTTIFYVVGSILVVAAGVLLITKKRMSREG